VAETARGESARVRFAAEAEAEATRQRAAAQAEATRWSGDAEAQATLAVGKAKAQAYQEGMQALGTDAYTSIQIAGILGENGVKLVPDIAVGGESGGLAQVMVARLLSRELHGQDAVKPS
jgi:uncharacterized membrane protein YqiK